MTYEEAVVERRGDSIALSLRAVGSSDYDAILAINAEGRPGVWPIDAADLRMVVERGATITVAIDSERIVGYMIAFTSDDGYDGEEFVWLREHIARFIYVDQIAVAASARRTGVGSKLYAALRARALQMRAADQGECSLVCGVNLDPPNPASFRFHLREGFEVVRGIIDTSAGPTVALLEHITDPSWHRQHIPPT